MNDFKVSWCYCTKTYRKRNRKNLKLRLARANRRKGRVNPEHQPKKLSGWDVI